MITNQLLKECLVSIFFKDKPGYEKFVVPLQDNWFVPKESINNLQDTWIGSSVLSHYSIQQPAIQHGSIILKNLNTHFRITFTGQKAEEFACSTLLWEKNKDVGKIFSEKMNAQINYDAQQPYSKIVEINDQDSLLIWVTDMKAKSCYAVDSQQIPCLPINGKLESMDNQQTIDLFSFAEKTNINREMTLEETINCKDRIPGKGLDDNFCRNKNCECLYKGYEEVYLYIDSQELSQGRKAKYTGATK